MSTSCGGADPICWVPDSIAEHGVAERAGRADGGGAGGDEFFGAGVADAVAGFFAEERESAAGSAAEAALMGARRFNEFSGEGDNGAGLLVDIAIAAEVAGVVEDDFVVGGWSGLIRGIASHPSRKLREMDGAPTIVWSPCLGSLSAKRARNSLWCSISGGVPNSFQSSWMVRTQWGQIDDDLLHLVLREGFEVRLGELLEEQVVAEAADGIAGAFLLAQDAVAGAEVVHDAGEVGDDLAALGIVSAHAAEPEAIFLGAVEDGECLLLDEFVAFERRSCPVR